MKIWAVLGIGMLCSSCGFWPRGQDSPVEERARIEKLSAQICALNSEFIDKKEASHLATKAVKEAQHLAQKYDLVYPCWWHNVLVNLGFRERGLCYHHAEDLSDVLGQDIYKTIYLTRGVREKGRIFHEHHCLVVLTKNVPFEKGLVLDSWLESGQLTWYQVGDDGYTWQENKAGLEATRWRMLENNLRPKCLKSSAELPH